MRAKRLMWAAAGGAAGLLLFTANCRREAPRPSAAAAASTPADVLELEQVLDAMARTWRPSDRARLLETLEPRAAALAGAALQVLERPDHPRLAATIQLAADLRLLSALPALQGLAQKGSGATAAAAVAAAEAIEPWPAAALTELLRDGTREQRLAALELCKARADRPVAAIEELLADDEVAVRGAALTALPDEVSDQALRQCLALAESGECVEAARTTLARLRPTDSQRQWLASQAAQCSPATRLALVQSGSGGSPAAEQTTWDVAGGSDEATRARAIELLDRNGCRDAQRVRAILPSLPPTGVFHAARCLVRAGERDGIRLLLDLAEQPEGEAADARSAARNLLAQLSGIPAAAGCDAWRAWYGSVLDVSQLPLPGELR